MPPVLKVTAAIAPLATGFSHESMLLFIYDLCLVQCNTVSTSPPPPIPTSPPSLPKALGQFLAPPQWGIQCSG